MKVTTKKIKKIKVKANSKEMPYLHMSPYEFLKRLNEAVKDRYDIQFKEVKYHVCKTKAEINFNNNFKSKQNFNYDPKVNNIFTGYPDLAKEIFKDALLLVPPTDFDPNVLDNAREQEKQQEQNKKLQDISQALSLIMSVHDYNSKTPKLQLKTIQAFKQTYFHDISEGQVEIHVKGVANQPVFDKIQQEKNSRRPIQIKHSNSTLKIYLHPFPNEAENYQVSDMSRITSWALCNHLKENSQTFSYFDMSKIQTNGQKVNGSIKPVNSLSLKQSPNQTIEGFQLVSFLFNEIVLKVSVNNAQVSRIERTSTKQNNKKVEQFYFYLKYPPKFYISILKKQTANMEDFIKNWQRVQNFPFLRNQIIKSNQLLRLYLFNNTIVKITLMSDPTQGYTIERSLQKLQCGLIKNIQGIISCENLKQRIPINNSGLNLLAKKFDYLNFIQKLKLTDPNKIDNIWKLKYFILIMVRYNHITAGQITSLLGFIEDHVNQLQYFIYLLWRQSTSLWGYNDQNVRLFEFIKSQFEKLHQLGVKNVIKNLSTNTQQIVHVFRASLTPSGYLFNPPTPEMKGRLLKQFSNQSQFFMRVSICDESQATLKNQKYITKCTFRNMMNEIIIVDRKYIPLGWSPSQLRSFSLWYINEINQQRCNVKRMRRDHILSFLGQFSKISNPAKKAARIGQSFSASWTFTLSKVNQLIEKDVRSEKGFLYTDGIGKISKDMLQKISLKLNIKDLSVIQMRYKGAKGVLVLDKRLDRNTIVLRDSLVKYDCEHKQAQKYLDILDWNKYKPGFLNRQVIILLKTLGIKDQIFKQLQKDHMKNIESMSFKDCSIFKQMHQDLNTDICNLQPANQTILQLLRAGFTLEEQPFFRGVLQTLKKNAYHQLKVKSSIRIQKSARIIGIIDQYGILNEKEIYCSVFDQFAKNPIKQVIIGKAIITRNPCLHPADIRIVNCISQEQIKRRFQEQQQSNLFDNYVNCVVFPMKGAIPITAQISGSDLDGDNFFICWDDRLIPIKEFKEQTIDQPPPASNSNSLVQKQQVNYEKMLDFFIQYVNYQKLGQIDNSHLVHADSDQINYALNAKALQLAKIHGKAVDFPKTGFCPPVDRSLLCSSYPDFMEKQNQVQYVSISILGQLYRDTKQKIQKLFSDNIVVTQAHIDADLVKNIPDFEKDSIKQAFIILKEYQRDLTNLISMVGVDSEYQIYSGNFSTVKEKIAAFGKNRLIATILYFRTRFFDMFFEDFQADKQQYLKCADQHLNKKTFLSETIHKKAILYYLLSYVYKFPKLELNNHDKFFQFKQLVLQTLSQVGVNLKDAIENSKTKYCGFVWFIIPKIIMNIKVMNSEKFTKQQNNQQLYKQQAI